MEKCTHSSNVVRISLDDYLAHLKSRKYSPRTVEIYEGAIHDFIGFAGELGRQKAVEILPEDLVQYRTWLLDRGFKEASLQVYLRAVKQWFAWLEETQQIFVNPAAGMGIFRCTRLLPVVPTQEDMRILLAQPDVKTREGVRDRAMLEVAYSTGVRRRELADLTVDSVNRPDKTIRVMGKGGKERVVPLGGEAAVWLHHYMEEVRPAFLNGTDIKALWITSFNSRALSPEAIQAILTKYRKAEGITTHISLHGIRRACATHMLRNGASPIMIQLLLGHETLQHLQHYLLLSCHDLKAMHEASKPGQ